jgi:isochorismate pyruvate lyase
MGQVRAAVDALDRRIVALLAERLQLVNQAARIKPDRSLVRDEARVEDVIGKVRHAAITAGIDPDFVEPLYRALVERSILHEFGEFDRLRGLPGAGARPPTPAAGPADLQNSLASSQKFP